MAKGKNKLNKTNSSGWLDNYSEESVINKYADGDKVVDPLLSPGQLAQLNKLKELSKKLSSDKAKKNVGDYIQSELTKKSQEKQTQSTVSTLKKKSFKDKVKEAAYNPLATLTGTEKGNKFDEFIFGTPAMMANSAINTVGNVFSPSAYSAVGKGLVNMAPALANMALDTDYQPIFNDGSNERALEIGADALMALPLTQLIPKSAARNLVKSGYNKIKNIEFPKQLSVSGNAVDFSKYLTQEEAVAARAERLISQKNKPGWNEQLTPELEQRLSTAVERHNPASDYAGEKLGANTMGRTATEVSKNANLKGVPLTEANKARVAAHETGHYYANSFDEGQEWLSHFNFNELPYKTRVYLRGKGNYTNYGNEVRERAAQLKDYIAQKNGIPLDQDFIITQPMLDNAIKNYVKNTGLDNTMSKMLGALTDKKGLLKTMNKYALGTIPAVIGAGAASQFYNGQEEEINQYPDGGIIDNIKEFFTEKTSKATPKSAPEKSSPKTFKIEDKRKVLATSGNPIRPNVDLTSGEYDLDVLNGIIESAKRNKLSIEDAKNLAAIAFQETKFGKVDENLGHVFDNVESRSDLEALTNAYITKMKEADRLGIKDDATRLQVYNGLGVIKPSTEQGYHGFKMKKIYGVPVPNEGINMKKNPLYGKQIMDLRDNVLNQNPEYVNYLNAAYNSKNPVPVYSDIELKTWGPRPLLGKFEDGGKINNDMKKKVKKYPAGGYLDYQEGFKGFGVGPQLYQDNSYFRSIMPDTIENMEEEINKPSVFSGINNVLGGIDQIGSQAFGLINQFIKPKMEGYAGMSEDAKKSFDYNKLLNFAEGKTGSNLIDTDLESIAGRISGGMSGDGTGQVFGGLPGGGGSKGILQGISLLGQKNGGYINKYQNGGEMDMLPVGSPEYIHKSNVFHENYNPVPRVHFTDDTTPFDMGVNLNDLVNMNGGRINKYQNGGDMSLQGYFNYLTSQNQNRVPSRAFNANTNRASLGALESANANDFLNTKMRNDRQAFEDDKVDWGFMDWAKEPTGALLGTLSSVPVLGDTVKDVLGDSFLTRTGGYQVGQGIGKTALGVTKIATGITNPSNILSGIGDIGEGVGSTVGNLNAKSAMGDYDKSGYVSGKRLARAAEDFNDTMGLSSKLYGMGKSVVDLSKGKPGALASFSANQTPYSKTNRKNQDLNFLLGKFLPDLSGGGADGGEMAMGGYLNNYQEGGMVSMPEDFEIPKFKKGGLTPKKAREILHDKSVHGNPLTDKQRKYFGYISSQKKSSGGWLDEL